MDQFPPNSKTAKAGAVEPKKIEKVASVSAKQRRKPLGKRFSETFIKGDAKSVGGYVVQTVVVPAVRDMIFEAGESALRKVIFGDQQRPRGTSPNPYGHVNYRGMSGGAPKGAHAPSTSRPSRARGAFDEIVIDTMQGAEEVIDRMLDVISQYDVVTVADLYELTGFKAEHTDHKWGWNDLRGAHASRLRGGGYLLDLPNPKPLD